MGESFSRTGDDSVRVDVIGNLACVSFSNETANLLRLARFEVNFL